MLGYQATPSIRLMRVRAVDQEDPACLRVGRDGLGDVGSKVVFGEGLPILTFRVEPILAQMRFERGPVIKVINKRSTLRGEILGTMPWLTASSARSPGVQGLTSRP